MTDPNHNPYRTLLFFFLLNCTFYAFGQEFKVRHITPRQGLPSQFVSSFTRDSTGFIWIGTSGGLCRFDGYNIEVFRHWPEDTNSISDDHVTCLLGNDDGDLLVGTYYEGLNRFNVETEKFIHYIHNPDDPATLSNNHVNVIYRDKRQVIWIGTQHGLNIFHPADGTFTAYVQNPGKTNNPCDQIQSLVVDSAGSIWVGTNDGLFQFDAEKKIFIPFPLTKGNTSNGNQGEIINCIEEIHDGSIWVGTLNWLYIIRDGIAEWTGPRSERTKYPSNMHIMDILEFEQDGRQQLWLATQWGLNRYDFELKQYEHYYNQPGYPGSFSSNNIRKLFFDRSGFFWLATHEHGIDVMDLRHNPFKNQVKITGHNFGHSAACFFEDNTGNIWVGSHEAGLLKYDKNLNLISRNIPRFPDNQRYDNGKVLKVLEDREGRIWTYLHNPRPGIYWFDEKSGLYHLVPYDTAGGFKAPSHVRDLLEDRDGIIWIATSSGLCTVKNREDREPHIHCIDHEILSREGIWDLAEDSSGNIWIASQAELYRISKKDPDTLNFTDYRFMRGEKSSPEQYPRCIACSRDGTIWIGTNRTFCRVDRDGQFYRQVDSRDELICDNLVISVIEDNRGKLWINSFKGLIRYDPGRIQVNASRLFDLSDGLPYDGYISTPLFMDNKGRIFVPSNYGTQNGFYYFYPDSLSENITIPAVVITGFNIRNDPFAADSSITCLHKVKLNYDQNFFSLEFAALDFSDPAKNQYAYKLEGFDEDWTYSGNYHFANYTAVPPGNYIFRVKGSNNDGVWNDAGTNLRIIISPPYWKTWWAYLLYGILIVSSVYIIFRSFLNRLKLLHSLEIEKLDAQKLKELDSMKSRFFANISHEFRTPLTLILGPLQKLIITEKDQSRKQDLSIMERNARQLHRLINQLLSLARLESGKLKLQASEHDLVPLIRNYLQSFESLAKYKNIDLVFRSGKDSIPIWVDREKMEQVMNNLLSNAFKFTPEGGRIEVTVSGQRSAVSGQGSTDTGKLTADRRPPTADLFANSATISIADTGPGISPDHLPHIFDRFYQAGNESSGHHESTGIGLALTRELVELHHGSVSVESEAGKGTVFCISLPLGNKHLKTDEIGRSQPDHVGIGPSMVSVATERFLTDPSEIDPNRPLLLVVEDNADMRFYIRGYFEGSFRIIEAGNGKEGNRKAIEDIPDIIISDVMMPEMDGVEFCRIIKTNELTSHVPLILLTARASRETRLEGLETGADDFITKPFDGEELVIRVRNLISQRNMLKERYRKEFDLAGILPDIPRSSMEQKFLQKAVKAIEQHISDPDFSVQHFAEEMAISRVQLHRKLHALVDRNATEFIRAYRLNKAAVLLTEHAATIAEIAYDVGFSSPSYFTECFRKHFGVNPSDYSGQHK